MIERIKLLLAEWYQKKTRYAGFKIAWNSEKNTYHAMYKGKWLYYDYEGKTPVKKNAIVKTSETITDGDDAIFLSKVLIDDYIKQERDGGLIYIDVNQWVKWH